MNFNFPRLQSFKDYSLHLGVFLRKDLITRTKNKFHTTIIFNQLAGNMPSIQHLLPNVKTTLTFMYLPLN